MYENIYNRKDALELLELLQLPVEFRDLNLMATLEEKLKKVHDQALVKKTDERKGLASALKALFLNCPIYVNKVMRGDSKCKDSELDEIAHLFCAAVFDVIYPNVKISMSAIGEALNSGAEEQAVDKVTTLNVIYVLQMIQPSCHEIKLFTRGKNINAYL